MNPIHQSWYQQIGEMEIARERGKTTQALQGLCAIRSDAAKAGDLEAAGLATAHIVVCYKHLFQNTGMPVYREQMETELQHALTLPVSGPLKAVFLMRRADLDCERKDIKSADSFFQQAYQLIEKNSCAEAECLGRWANVKTMLGDLREAENLFERAEEVIAAVRSSKNFQRITLLSGLFARETRLFLRQKRYAKAFSSFLKGYSLAWEYRIRFGMPQRIKQYHQAIRSVFRAK